MLRGGIEVNANEIHTTLYCLVEGVLEFCLVYIVLILAYTNALRIDLYKFCQRIHQTTTYRDSTTNSHIFIRKLIACYL